MLLRASTWFQRRNCCLAANGRKVVEEFVQTLPAFEIVNECLEGHAGSPKHRNSAENVPIFDDDLVHIASSLSRPVQKSHWSAPCGAFRLE
jgi:hypothetical protein